MLAGRPSRRTDHRAASSRFRERHKSATTSGTHAARLPDKWTGSALVFAPLTSTKNQPAHRCRPQTALRPPRSSASGSPLGSARPACASPFELTRSFTESESLAAPLGAHRRDLPPASPFPGPGVRRRGLALPGRPYVEQSRAPSRSPQLVLGLSGRYPPASDTWPSEALAAEA